MDPVLAPFALLFFATLGFDLGLFSGSSSSSSSDTTTDTTTDATTDTDPVAEPGNFDASLYSETVTGTEGADSLSSDQEDALAWFLQGGNDSLTGTNGSDYVEGGTGDDTLSMRDGRDLVYGGEGNDSIDAGIGFDTVYGGEGDDSVTGNGGNDVILGDEGNDVLAGGTGADLLYGGAGDDVLYGMSAGLSTGDSAIEIDGVDGLSGGDGNDHLILGPGDIGEGGAGDDVFEIDHSRTDLTEVARVNDFSAGDTIEVSYTPEFDTQGVEIAPVISLIENSDATGTLIMFNDVEIANIITEQTLTAAQIILTATPR